MADSPQMVPARYIGHHPALLRKAVRTYHNIDGSPRAKLVLEAGDTLMMPAAEILGQTLLFDPKGVRNPLNLGVGKRVLPEDVSKDDRELALLGYEFHQGRADFEPVDDTSSATPASTDTSSATPTDSPSTESDIAPVSRVMGG